MNRETIARLGYAYTGAFIRSAKQLCHEERESLEKALRLLGTNPRHPSLRTKRVRGSRTSNIYEARLNARHRLIFSMEKPICLRYVADHDDALQKAVLYNFIMAGSSEFSRNDIDELYEPVEGFGIVADILAKLDSQTP